MECGRSKKTLMLARAQASQVAFWQKSLHMAVINAKRKEKSSTSISEVEKFEMQLLILEK